MGGFWQVSPFLQSASLWHTADCGVHCPPTHLSPLMQSESWVQLVLVLGMHVPEGTSQTSPVAQSASFVHFLGGAGAQKPPWQVSTGEQSLSLVQAFGLVMHTLLEQTSPFWQSASRTHVLTGKIQKPEMQSSPVWQSLAVVQFPLGVRQYPERHLKTPPQSASA